MFSLEYINWVPLLLYSLLFAYVIMISIVIIGWHKTVNKSIDTHITKSPTKFSILLAIRNEANNIERIIYEIFEQDFPKDSFELIIIDDHSEDNSLELISKVSFDNLRVLKSFGIGKKDALREGLKYAKHAYIVQTDADCFIPKNWLSSISNYIKKYQPKLLAAPVIIKKENHWLSKFQMLDFMSLMAITAGFIGVKKAVMLNAANLIYPKDIVENNDFLNQKTASGDDIFLLQNVKKNYGKDSIHYFNSKLSTIETKASINLKTLFNQRLRWASKSKYYKDIDTIIVGGLTFLFNFYLAVMGISSLFSQNLFIFFIIGLIGKMLIDLLLLSFILRFYKQLQLLIYFPALSIIYPFYVSFVGLLSPFISYNWKNRSVK